MLNIDNMNVVDAKENNPLDKRKKKLVDEWHTVDVENVQCCRVGDGRSTGDGDRCMGVTIEGLLALSVGAAFLDVRHGSGWY